MVIHSKWMQAAGAAFACLSMFALTGCSAPEKPAESGETKPDATASTGPKPKIAVSIPTATHGWTAGIVYWAEKTAKDLAGDADITVVAAESPQDQATKLETMATQGYDALVVLSFEPAQVTPVIKANRDSFGYIVSVDRGLTEPIADVWLRGDNKEFGKLAGEFMAEKLGGKGNILVFRGIPSPIDNDRVEGFQGVMKNYPDIKILDMQHGDWNRDKAFTVAQNLLVKHPKVDAIWASDDDMALGIEKALQGAGRDKDIWMVGGAGMKDVVKRIMDNDPLYPATVTYSPKMIADAIQRCVDDLKAGKKSTGTQEDVVLPIEIVVPENAEKHYFPDSKY